LQLQSDLASGDSRADVQVHSCQIEDVYEVGLAATAADVAVVGTHVHRVRSRDLDGLFGDGMMVASAGEPGLLTVLGSVVAASGRAGVSAFGAHAALGHCRLDCNAISLDGETFDGHEWTLEDLGGNACGCGDHTGVCMVASASLEPPAPLGPPTTPAPEG
jgi:hypothetical protein